MKEYPQRTGCSNWVADQALWSQLFLDEMKEHPGWNNAHRKEWNLFLLEWMFHNAAIMWCKRCSHRLPLEPSETALEHPSMQTLVGSRMPTSSKSQNRYLRASMWWHPACSPMHNTITSWTSYKGSCLGPWPRLAYKVKGGQVNCLRSWRHSRDPEEEDQALEVKQQDKWSWLGRRKTHSRGRSGSRW